MTIQKRRLLTQYSTFSALMGGDLHGSFAIQDITKNGNFGLGTFHALDGELIVLDGTAYQMLATGDIKKAAPDMKTPFASVTSFEADKTLTFSNISYETFEQELIKSFPSQNIFYAIKVKGDFEWINMRAVTKQSEPFPSIKQAAKEQKEFMLKDMSGDLVIFWGPKFTNLILVQGFHSHFISDDRKIGGHVFNFSARSLSVEISYLTNMNLILPTSDTYLQYKIDEDNVLEDIKNVESQR